MSQNNHKVVPRIFPHTIAVTQIKHSRAAYDLIKWCIDHAKQAWHKHTVDNILYIQFSAAEDMTMFLLNWGTDNRIEYTVVDVTQQLGL